MAHTIFLNFTALDIFLYINILIALSFIFFSKKPPSTTWAWIMIMLFIPILGFVLYLLFGQDLRKRKTFSKKEEQDRFLALIHLQHTDLWSHMENDDEPLVTEYSHMINLHLNAHESIFTDDNTLQILIDGATLFEDLFQNLRQAQKYIHLESYIIRNDSLGIALKELLITKSKEGVEVLLLYDDVGSFTTSKKYFDDLRHAGVKVACFFPSFIPLIKLSANYRNHRKICIIDGSIAYLGGFNIGKEYIGLNKKLGYWRDTHLKIVGSSVNLVDLQFLLDYRFATKKHICLNKYSPIETPHKLGSTAMQIVSSGPDSRYPSIRNGYIALIHAAKKSIYIQTPYFIPDEGVLTAIKLAALSGIDVRIMIPNKPDHMFVYWATYYHIGEILDCGARCYTYENGFLHSKTIVVDNALSSVGTANFDVRSFKLNFEINAFIYDLQVANALTSIFMKDLTYCTQLTKETYANRGSLIRFKESISRLISPLL